MTLRSDSEYRVKLGWLWKYNFVSDCFYFVFLRCVTRCGCCRSHLPGGIRGFRPPLLMVPVITPNGNVYLRHLFRPTYSYTEFIANYQSLPFALTLFSILLRTRWNLSLFSDSLRRFQKKWEFLRKIFSGPSSMRNEPIRVSRLPSSASPPGPLDAELGFKLVAD